MYNVHQVLQMKGRDVWSVTPDSTVLEAIQLLSEKNVGALLVLEDGQLAGIVSERDIVRLIGHQGTCKLDGPVKEYMTKVLFTIAPGETMEDCMKLMSEKKIRHLPVVDRGQLVGIISISDVVREVIENREETIHNLQDYIQGTGYGR